MAKKLNTKVAVIGVVLLLLVIGAGVGFIVVQKIRHNPDRALAKAKQALEAGDYETAKLQYGRACGLTKTDEGKIERYFDLAEFSLIQNDQHNADWDTARGCWAKVVELDSKNMKARRLLLDFVYQAADAGSIQLWKRVKEHTTKMIEVLQEQNLEPDADLLITHARATLAIAQRGDTPNRKELLDEGIERLETLIAQHPENDTLYQYRAEAALLTGTLNELTGIRNAAETAREEAFQWLQAGIEQADDKATATATYWAFKMQTEPADPNTVDQLRTDIEAAAKTIQPNDTFNVVLSRIYSERQGHMDPQSETNRAIEAMRQARQLAPDNIEYILRLSNLLYRKGSAFDDTDAITDALQLTEEALTLPNTQDVPGPLQGRNLQYRFLLNSFLSNVYLQKAFAANSRGDEAAAKEWADKARPLVKQISDYVKSDKEAVVQKFKGMLLLADGERDKGIREMVKAYEQSKALDKEGQLSAIDPFLCLTLADVMKQQNEPGMAIEFLGKAVSNRTFFVLQKPQLLLDYAELLAGYRAWGSVLNIVNNYQSRYGANTRSQHLKAQALIAAYQSEQDATIAANLFDQAQTEIASMDADTPETIQLQIAQLSAQMGKQARDIETLKDENKEPTAEQTQELAQLRQKRQQLLTAQLAANAANVDTQSMTAVCYDLIRNNQAKEAAALLESFLAANPDNIEMKVLLLQTQEDNPKNITTERRRQLQVQAIETLSDPKEKYLALALLYRVANEPEKALEQLDKLSQADAENTEILEEKFEIALLQKDFETAKNLQNKLRQQNADGCAGSLLNARIALGTEDYEQALRELEQCQKLQPLSSRIHFLKGQVYTQQEDYEAAVKSFQQAVRMNSRNPVYARNLAATLYTRNQKLGSKVTPQQKSEALQATVLASQLDPVNWQLQSVYAENIFDSNPDKAFMIRRSLLKNYPTASNAIMLGRMAERMAASKWGVAKRTKLAEAALDAYRQAIEIDPENEDAQLAYADLQRKLGKDPLDDIKDDKNLLWKYYLQGAQFEQARDILVELLEKTPDDALLLRGLIAVDEGLGNRSQIKEHLNKLAAADDSKETQLWLLQKYLDNGYMDEAETKLAAFKASYPEESVVMLVEAWIQMGNGQLQEAFDKVSGYLETETENPGAWRLSGRLNRLMSRPQKAITDLQRSKSILADPMVRLELATVYRETGNIEAAIGELRQGLEDPRTPLQVRLMLEQIYRESGKARELEGFFKSTLEKYPQSFFWHYRAGEYYASQNNFTKALPLLKTSWEFSVQQKRPDLGIFVAYLDALCGQDQYDTAFSFASEWIDTALAPVAYAYMAQAQLKQQKQSEAMENFNKALDKAGASDRMQSLVMEKMLDTVGQDALVAWQKAQLAKDEKSLPARLLTYRLAVKNERFNEAIDQAGQCLEIVGPDHPGWMSLAMKQGNAMIMAYTKTADPDYLNRSIALFETILAKQPNNPTLLNNVAYLLADNDKQLETALGYARKAHQSNPGNTIFLDTYAYIQCKLGEYEQAERNLLRAIQLLDISREPIPWDMYKHLAMAREGLGKNAQAVEDYQKALEAADGAAEKQKQQLQQAIDKLKALL